MLCEVCRAVFSYRGSDIYGFNNQIGGHHANTLSLIEAASGGCRMCTQIERCALKKLETLEQVEMRLRIAEIHVDLAERDGTIWTHVVNHMISPGPNEQAKREDWQYFTFVAVTRSTTPISINVGTRKPGAFRSIFDVANTARAFVSHCAQEHLQCAARTASTKYPTRLLELGKFTARIIHPSVDGALGSYVALSYCWGPNPSFLRLTECNKDELRSGIPLDRLPLAFREAIEIVKSLEYRYIWIDSLCILQEGAGSEEDWRTESARMGDVYSNSILNLSLSRASSPDISCLGGPEQHPLMPPFAADVGNESFIIVDRKLYREAKYRQPLGLRAWTFQERVLAPRVLALGQGELFWDCMETREASESFPLGLSSRLSEELGVAQLEITIPSKQLPLHEFYMNWQRILDNYTPRMITYVEKDRLIALGAVASRICQAQNDIYIAGHFLSTLPYSLLWRLHNWNDGEKWSGTMGKRVNSKDMRAPSWSWASIDGPVRHYTGSQRLSVDMWPDLLATVVGNPAETVKLADKLNPFGQCVSASITISTVCTEIVWSQATPGWQLLDKTKTLENCNQWKDVDLIVWLDDPDQRFRMVDGSRFTLAAFCDGYLMGSDQPLAGRQGLVLQECMKDEGKVYKRVAHFRLGFREKPHTGQTLIEFESARLRRGWKEVAEVFETENRTLVLI